LKRAALLQLVDEEGQARLAEEAETQREHAVGEGRTYIGCVFVLAAIIARVPRAFLQPLIAC
jgi:hypothetical protein